MNFPSFRSYPMKIIVNFIFYIHKLRHKLSSVCIECDSGNGVCFCCVT